MKLAGIVIVLLAAIAGGQANNIITNSLNQWMQQFRLDMECGFPQSGLPVLAPFRHARLQADINLNEFAFQGALLNVFTGDLNTFIVRSIDFNMIFMRMDFHFHFPSITVQGQFAQGVGRSPGGCSLFGAGNFAVRMNAVDHRLTARMVLRGGTLEMGEMTTRLTIGSFQSNIASFVGTAAQNAGCNAALQQNMPRIIAQQQAAISRWFDNLLRPVANNHMNGMTLADMLDMITVTGPPTPCRRMAVASADEDGTVDVDVEEEEEQMVPALDIVWREGEEPTDYVPEQL